MSDFFEDPLAEIIALDRHIDRRCDLAAEDFVGRAIRNRVRDLYEHGASTADASTEPFRSPSPPRSFARAPLDLFKNAKPSGQPRLTPAQWRLVKKSIPRRDSVEQVARELGRTPRQVKRYLAQLVQAGKAPASWSDGYQYRPDERVAAALIRQEIAASARRPKKTERRLDAWEMEILKLRDQRKRAVARLHEQREKARWLSLLGEGYSEQWGRQQMARLDIMEIVEFFRRFRVEAAELARKAIASSPCGMKRWMLQIGFYHARVRECAQPVEHVCRLLGVSPSTFWRKYGHDPHLMKAARDGGDGFYNVFASGGTPAQLLKAKPRELLTDREPDGETSDEPSAWDEQFFVHAAGRRL